jgi:hypothetical protein
LKTLPALPYLLPPEDAVIEQPWADADGTRLSDRLEHWDPFTDTEFFRAIDVDLDKLRAGCRLNVDATFALCTTWHSNRTRLSGVGQSIELGTLRGRVRAPMSLVVPGAASGGRLELRTSLILRHPGTNGVPISPRREGAILWLDSKAIALEGGSARFPVTALDFEASGRLPPGASWALEWNPEHLDGPVLGDLRLLVNSKDETLLNALRSGAADAKSSVVRSFILFDVARALIEGALSNDNFVCDPGRFDDGSVGRMISELVSACWPGVPVTTLVSRRREDPARLGAELQAHLQVFK